ncbi:MAG: DUF5664 domain-containing protein [Nitrosopumilus sp.]
MKSKFKTKDSGTRKFYDTGMIRDTRSGKVRFDLCWYPMLRRWAELMMRGADKYGENNWQFAKTGEEHDRFVESALRHLYQWAHGEDPEEDHAAAVFFNIASAEYTKERMNRKR